MRRNIEAAEQRALIKWAMMHPIARHHLIAIPNGGTRRDVIEAKNLQRAGVKSGVSDLFLAYPTKTKAGLWIELKPPKPSRSKLSESQQKWITLMNNSGYSAIVAYGWNEAVIQIKDYLSEGKS